MALKSKILIFISSMTTELTNQATLEFEFDSAFSSASISGTATSNP